MRQDETEGTMVVLPTVSPGQACLDSFKHLTPATRRIRSAGVPREAQIPSHASTCRSVSFLES